MFKFFFQIKKKLNHRYVLIIRLTFADEILTLKMNLKSFNMFTLTDIVIVHYFQDKITEYLISLNRAMKIAAGATMRWHVSHGLIKRPMKQRNSVSLELWVIQAYYLNDDPHWKHYFFSCVHRNSVQNVEMPHKFQLPMSWRRCSWGGWMESEVWWPMAGLVVFSRAKQRQKCRHL